MPLQRKNKNFRPMTSTLIHWKINSKLNLKQTERSNKDYSANKWNRE